MTKISNYPADESISGDDKWIGSDAGNSFNTKNFTATKLGEYFNAFSTLNTQDSIVYPYLPMSTGQQRRQRGISFNEGVDGTVLFQDTTFFIIGKETIQGVDITQYADFMKGTKCLLYNVNDVNKFFLFRVIDVIPLPGEPNFLKFTVEFIDGNDGFRIDETYGITIKDLVGTSDSDVSPAGNRIVLSNGFTLVGNTFTLLAGWNWLINNVPYTNPTNVVITIPLASAGNQRLDLIALNTSNTAVRVAGTESTTTPVAPALPSNTLQATILLVDNTNIGLVGKEDISNKQNSLVFDGTGQKYTTVDTVNETFLRNTKLASRTGIADKHDQFELLVADVNTVTIKACDTVVFWDELFETNAVSGDAVKSFPQKTYPLSELIMATGGNINTLDISADGVYVRYLGYNKDGNVVSSPNNFIESSSVAQLGFVTVVKSGFTVAFLGGTTPGGRNVFSQPILASTHDVLRTTVTPDTDVTIDYNTGTPSLKSNPGTITGLSINWRGISNVGNTSPIDKFNYAGDSVVDFVSLDPNFLEMTSAPTVHTLWTETDSGVAVNNSFFNTTSQLRDTLAADTFAIKRVLIGLRGGIFIQESEFASSAAYSTIDEAKANVFTHNFTDSIIPPDVVIEIARIVFKKGVTDFSDETQFYIVMTAGGAGSGGGIASVADATTLTKGVIQLAGDLSGTASAPTVPALALKEVLANKQNSLVTDGSGNKYPTVDAVNAGLVLKENAANKTNTVSGNEASTTLFGTIKAWTDYLKQGFIGLLPAKATVLVDADYMVIGDSADSNKTKTRTFGELKSNIATIVQNVQSGTTYTLVNSDNGKQIVFTNAAAVALTVPTGLTSGFNCDVLQQGTGQVTIVASGTTLHYLDYEFPTTYSQKACVGIDNVPNLTETYRLFGELSMI